MGDQTRNPTPTGTDTARPPATAADTASDTETASDGTPVQLTYEGDPVRIPTDATAADLKDALSLPAADTVLIAYRGETVALHDTDTVATYAPDGATIQHAPVRDDMSG